MCCDVNEAGKCIASRVWVVDGNVPFLGGCHLPLFIVSVIILVVFTLFTTLIISIPYQEKYLSNRSVKIQHWLMLLKPWYDAYSAPYKDTYRSWTGILLLIRCILGLVVGLRNDTTISLVVLSLACLLLTLFVVFFPIYKRTYLNSLEIFSFASLSAMSVLSAVSNANFWYTYSIVILFNVVLLAIIVYHIYQKMMQYQCFCSRLSVFKTPYALKLGKQRKTGQKELEDKEKTVPVPTTVVNLDDTSLREPQLEESSFNQ